MKTPDEIKEYLANCDDKSECSACYSEWRCKNEADALAYIQQLEAELEEERTHHQHTIECAQSFEEEWVQMKRERDAAVRDIRHDCDTCKHKEACLSNDFCEECGHAESDNTPCCSCHNLCNWEWRGPCAENGGIHDL